MGVGDARRAGGGIAGSIGGSAVKGGGGVGSNGNADAEGAGIIRIPRPGFRAGAIIGGVEADSRARFSGSVNHGCGAGVGGGWRSGAGERGCTRRSDVYRPVIGGGSAGIPCIIRATHFKVMRPFRKRTRILFRGIAGFPVSVIQFAFIGGIGGGELKGGGSLVRGVARCGSEGDGRRCSVHSPGVDGGCGVGSPLPDGSSSHCKGMRSIG